MDWAKPVYQESRTKVFQSSFRRSEFGGVQVFTDIKEVSTDRFDRIEPEELLLTALSGRALIPKLFPFRPIGDEIGSFLKYNIYPNTLREPQLVSQETTLLESGSNLASVLKRINSNRRYASSKEDIISAMQMIMPSIVDIQVRSAAGFYVPVLRVREIGGDVHDFNLSKISDGTLRTLGLLAAFYQPNAPGKSGLRNPSK